MATQEPSQGGLPNIGVDLTKAPLYGQGTDEYMETIQKAQQDAIKALQDRYANPNWFKVAAGFGKPQLGGFAASLGSAFEALGENTELERAQQMPIQQLKMQMAQTGALMKTTKDVNDEIRKWTTEHPGEEIPSDKMRDWVSRAPDSQGVKGLKDQIADAQKKLGYTQTQQQIASAQRQANALEQRQKSDILDKQEARNEALMKTNSISSAQYRAEMSRIAKEREDLFKAVSTGSLPTTTDFPPFSKDNPAGNKGSNVPNASAPDTNAPAPAPAPVSKPSNAPAPVKPPSTGSSKPASGYLPEVHVLPQFGPSASDVEAKNQEAQRALTQERASRDEEFNQKQYQGLQSFARYSGAARDVSRAWQTIQNAYKDDSKGVQSLVDAVREGGPLQAAMSDGFAFYAGNISANVSLPVNKFKIAGLDENKRTTYDNVASAFATLANAELARQGIDPKTATLEQYKTALGIGSTAEAAYRSAGHSALNFQEQAERAKLIQEEFKRTKPSSLARYTDAFHSPKVDSHRAGYDSLHQDFDHQFKR